MSANTSNLMVRMDEESKQYITQAAKLRRISISDYVRMMIVPQARRDVSELEQNTLSLKPEEQLAFWNALNQTPRLTEAQRELGAIMRSDA